MIELTVRRNCQLVLDKPDASLTADQYGGLHEQSTFNWLWRTVFWSALTEKKENKLLKDAYEFTLLNIDPSWTFESFDGYHATGEKVKELIAGRLKWIG
ncbi:MAG: hypothetical protein KDK48_00455 [Chlamydiia bacterium]|nr:hypothetical protein [Chlamydiia bacterium]